VSGKFVVVASETNVHKVFELDASSIQRPAKLGLQLKDGQIVWQGRENRIVINNAFMAEMALWLPYLVALYLARIGQRLGLAKGPSLHFGPQAPGPWYLIVGAAAWGGVRIQRTASPETQSMYFDDVTQEDGNRETPNGAINAACTDISKSKVALTFHKVFGYPLSVDPLIHCGLMIEKPEINGAHGGQVVSGPLIPKLGFVYQKLIDTADLNNQCNDLRTPCIGGVPALVWRKLKSPSKRFDIHNMSARLLDPGDVFTSAELILIIRFNLHMGLECGGLDILRDTSDGRIYIVDVNKTDIGPLIVLSWADKMKSMAILGSALGGWLIRRSGVVTSTPSVM
jgi:hypothetical protein